jgi:hypothetical protein
MDRVPTGTTILVVAASLACNGSPSAPGSFDELCGQTDPVLLLSLEADQSPSTIPLHAIRRVGERLVYVVEEPEEHALFSVHSTGTCGEDRALVVEGVDFLFDPRHAFGDAVLACREATDEVLVLDPTGSRAPWPALVDVGCAALPVGAGVVGVRRHALGSDTGDLVYRSSLSDPDGPLEVLAGDVLVPLVDTYFLFADIRRLRTFGDEVLALTSVGDILTIDVEQDTSWVEISDVAAFELSYDGGFILYQPGPPHPGGVFGEEREMLLRDRSTGEDLALGKSAFGTLSGGVQTGMVRVADRVTGGTNVVLLPSLQQLYFPPERFVNGRHPESGFVMWTPSSGGSSGILHVFDPDTETSMPVFDRRGSWTYEEDQFLLLEKTGENAYTLWERYLDDPAPVRVADDVFQPFFVASDKLATIGDLEEDRHGTLYILDRDSGERIELDHRVNAFSGRLNWLHALGDAFAYAVSDADRSGIYAARVR